MRYTIYKKSIFKTIFYSRIQRPDLIERSIWRGFNSRSAHNESARIEWFYIPAGVGFSVLCLLQLKHILQRNEDQKTIEIAQGFTFKPWQVEIMRMLPSRVLSRFWGLCCDVELPLWSRSPLINTYSRLFNCNLEEALINDVTKFTTLNEFFMRKLKPGSRKIDATAVLVSPADATVLSFGAISHRNMNLEQIKGMTYPLSTFVGPRHPFFKKLCSCFPENDPTECSIGRCNEDHDDFKIFYCTLYLAPGDYHWFHSPTEWTIEQRRHIPGDLFSVNPKCLRAINSIFNMNERVLLSGHWEHGLFMYAAVGAYNVGSIKLAFPIDKNLETNSFVHADGFRDKVYTSGVLLRRGDPVGKFKLGSSILMVFTAPRDFRFDVQLGDKVKYGQALGSMNS